MLYSGWILFPLIEFLLTIKSGEDVVKVAGGFGGAEKESATGAQRVVKEGDQFLLQIGVQIDQEIAATEQVKFGECRVFVDVMFGKDQEIANRFIDAI